jgi:hypothetical protein
MKMKSQFIWFGFCLFFASISPPAFCDTDSRNVEKNKVELAYRYLIGGELLYSRMISNRYCFDFFFDYDYFKNRNPQNMLLNHDQEKYAVGAGLQHQVVQFGIWDFSMVYFLRESFLLFHYFDDYSKTKTIEYGTEVGADPRIQLHFHGRFYSYLSIGPVFIIKIFEDHTPNFPPTIKMSYGFQPEALLGIGCNF